MEFLNPITTRPSELKAGDKLCYIVVASIGQANDWAAYFGLADWTPSRVAREGDKLDKEVAERLFPVCVRAGLTYRL